MLNHKQEREKTYQSLLNTSEEVIAFFNWSQSQSTNNLSQMQNNTDQDSNQEFVDI